MDELEVGDTIEFLVKGHDGASCQIGDKVMIREVHENYIITNTLFDPDDYWTFETYNLDIGYKLCQKAVKRKLGTFEEELTMIKERIKSSKNIKRFKKPDWFV